MTAEVTVRHNFETGHRLPILPGKCQSLHGHSWWAEVTLRGTLNEDGILVEFGAFKSALRTWIDLHWDHGLILGQADPLYELLKDHGKVYQFPGWPTVEAVAGHLAAIAKACLSVADASAVARGVIVARVDVRETHVNQASWLAHPWGV